MSSRQPGSVILAYGFRPFFLLTACSALWLIACWIGVLLWGDPRVLGPWPLQWHSHEVLYGMVSAAIAGFLLTAITNWTGARPLQGGPLLALVLLWLAGRLGFLWVTYLPASLLAAVDVAFLPVVALYVAQVLWRSRNYRNLLLVAVLLALSCGNLMMHWGFLHQDMHWMQRGERLGIDIITLVIIIVAGRILPAFSANWLRLQDQDPQRVVRSPLVDKLALLSVVLLALLQVSAAAPTLVAWAALLAGAINGLRWLLWSGWRSWPEPLLWILHIAYGCVVLALLLRGIEGLLPGSLPATLWLHIWGVGGVATLILGVMTRVCMGHTGRPLRLQPYGIWIYLSILAATLLRALTALGWMPFTVGIGLAAAAWLLAFALFLLLYAPILWRPRADGRPG